MNFTREAAELADGGGTEKSWKAVLAVKLWLLNYEPFLAFKRGLKEFSQLATSEWLLRVALVNRAGK